MIRKVAVDCDTATLTLTEYPASVSVITVLAPKIMGVEISKIMGVIPAKIMGV
jgi:hypothetical protein